MEEVDRGDFMSDFIRRQLRVETVHNAFKKFMVNLKGIYDGMVSVDKMLLEAGIQLPWSDLKPQPIIYERWDFYALHPYVEVGKSRLFSICHVMFFQLVPCSNVELDH